jgi:peroxiredoxin
MGLLRDWGLAFAIVVVVFGVWNFIFAPSPVDTGPAPAFTLTNLDGAEVTLAEQQAEVIVLNFWFTSCAPCRAEIPELARWHDDHPDVAMYGISTDAGMPTPKLKAISRKLGINYPVLHDKYASVARDYGVAVFPTTFVIKGGKIGAVRIGVLNTEILDQMVHQVN